MKTRNIIALTLAGFFGLALITSCGGGKTGEQSTTDTTAVTEAAQPGTPSAEQMALGKSIYETQGKCITCHQATGLGIANVFPNLVGSKFLLEQKTQAVAQVLNGSLKIGNKTVKYPAPMPPQVGSADSAVAVINYVLNSFGNAGGMVTLEEVKDIVIDPR
jgi:mono/diheme cytochrome c family protein